MQLQTAGRMISFFLIVFKDVEASLQVMRRAKGRAVSMGKDTACHQESRAAEVMEQYHPPLNHLQQFLCCGFFSPPFQILPLGTEWEHWKSEPNSLPEAAETCLQLPSYLHFSNGLISKSFYKPGPQITSWKHEKILDRDEEST